MRSHEWDRGRRWLEKGKSKFHEELFDKKSALEGEVTKAIEDIAKEKGRIEIEFYVDDREGFAIEAAGVFWKNDQAFVKRCEANEQCELSDFNLDGLLEILKVIETGKSNINKVWP